MDLSVNIITQNWIETTYTHSKLFFKYFLQYNYPIYSYLTSGKLII